MKTEQPLAPTAQSKETLPLELVLVTVTLALVNWLWFTLDHTPLSQDEAGHILNAWHFQELFAQPNVFHLHWWKELLEVNRCYPPTTYVFAALLKLIPGGGREIDNVVMVFFSTALVLGVYYIGRLLNLSRRVAVMAAALLSMYPLTAVYSHKYYLDMQLAAAVACGLWALLWWRKDAAKNAQKRAIVAGVLIGVCCLVKHLVAIFIAGGAFVIIAEHFRAQRFSKDSCISFALLVFSALVVLLPWVIFNASFIAGLTQDNLHYMQQTGQSTNFFKAARQYLSFLPESMSPLLLGIGALSIFSAGTKYHRALLPLTLSALFGMFVTCCWNAATPINRYLTAALICPSFYTAIFLDRLLASKQIAQKILAAALLTLALIQYTAFCFSPYPIRWLKDIPHALGLNMQNPQTNSRELGCPQPAEDWGYTMVSKKIAHTDGSKPVWLNVMVNMPQLNTHSYELLVKEKGYSFKPTTSRAWTVSGDKIEFSPKNTLYYDWFLLKSGNTGNHWLDSNSERNYSALVTFVRTSGLFQLAGEQDLPDGSKLELFRQIKVSP